MREALSSFELGYNFNNTLNGNVKMTCPCGCHECILGGGGECVDQILPNIRTSWSVYRLHVLAAIPPGTALTVAVNRRMGGNQSWSGRFGQ